MAVLGRIKYSGATQSSKLLYDLLPMMQNGDGIEQESVREMLDKTIITTSNIPPQVRYEICTHNTGGLRLSARN
jgi:hypothetical protein